MFIVVIDPAKSDHQAGNWYQYLAIALRKISLDSPGSPVVHKMHVFFFLRYNVVRISNYLFFHYKTCYYMITEMLSELRNGYRNCLFIVRRHQKHIFQYNFCQCH